MMVKILAEKSMELREINRENCNGTSLHGVGLSGTAIVRERVQLRGYASPDVFSSCLRVYCACRATIASAHASLMVLACTVRQTS
jgi:hypothetical protein